MCNLYSLSKPRNQIASAFGVSDNRAETFEPKDAIFPGHGAPIVRRAGAGSEREIVLASWGFVLPQPGRAPRRVTNARDDKVRSSRFWTESFETRRCLVPATSYCEPNGASPASWFWFALNHTDEAADNRPLFAFPGLWRRWSGPIRKDGPDEDVIVFAFLTTLPNSLTASINHERMPVLLTEIREFETWLSGSPAEAFALVRSLEPERMRIVQAGNEKRDLLLASASTLASSAAVAPPQGGDPSIVPDLFARLG